MKIKSIILATWVALLACVLFSPAYAVQTRLTMDPGNEFFPNWDPASSTIAYLVRTTPIVWNIKAVQSNGAGEGFIGTGANSPFGLGWSLTWDGSSGRLITNERISLHEYLSFTPNAGPPPVNKPRTAFNGNDANYTRELFIPGGGGGDFITISRDGKTAVWRSSTGGCCGTQNLRTISHPTDVLLALTGGSSATTGTLIKSIFDSVSSHFTEGGLSPDGALFVLVERTSTAPLGFDLFLYTTATGALVRRLTFDGTAGAHNRFPEISPDGTTIAFSHSTGITGETWEIMTIPIAGGVATNITNTPADYELYPTWSPDGTQLAFSGALNSGALPGETPNNNIFVCPVNNCGLPGSDVTPPTGSVSINAGSGFSNSTAVTLSLTCNDGAGSGCADMQLSNDGVTFSAPQPFAATASWSLAAGADGARTVTTRFTDVVGNVSTATISASITLDTLPPAAPTITSPTGGGLSQNTALVISGTAEPNALINVRDGAASVGLVSADGAGNWSVPVLLTEGAHSFTASATDGAGNVGLATLAVAFTVDTTAPVFPNGVPAPVTGVEATSAVGAVATFPTPLATDAIDINPSVACIPASGSTFSLGNTPVACTATDAAGNSSNVSFNVTVVDTTMPAITMNGLSTVTVEAGSLYSDAGATASDIVDGNVTASITSVSTVNTAIPGAYTVTYAVVDATGNSSTASRTVNVVDTILPVIAPPLPAVVTATGVQTTVALVAPVATDLFGPVTVTNNAPLTFPLGLTTVVWTATDANGNIATATQTVTVNAPNIALMTPAQIALLTPAQLALLSPAQVAALTPVQLGAILVSLTPVQVAALTPIQVGVLTPLQLGTILVSLTPVQVAALTPIQIGALTPVQLGAILVSLTPVQVAALTLIQIGALTPVQVGAILVSLTPVQIAALTPVQIAVLAPVQVAMIFGSLVPAQVALLAPAQLAGLATEADDDKDHDDGNDDKDKDKKSKKHDKDD